MIDNYSLIKANDNKNFVINDIELFVDPTSISIHKENLEYSYKTLRSRGSTKVASGNGAIHLQLNLVFSPEMIIQLHRLICQIRNIPFVYIKNDFIESSIGVGIQNTSCHFTVFGFSLNNHQSSPGSFVCQIDLRYFNTQPYSKTIEYLYDYKYVSKENTKTYKYTHGVYEKYNRIKYKADSDKTNNSSIINFNNSKNELYSKLSVNENPYKEYEYSFSFYDPRSSNAYKRYSNYIQYQSLKENFGIEIIKNETSNYDAILELKVNESIYNQFETAKIIEPLYSILNNELLEFNKHLSYAILSKCLDFKILFKDFKRETFSPELLKEFRKALYEGVTKDMTYKEIEEKKKRNYKNLLNYEKQVKDSNQKKEHKVNDKKPYYFLSKNEDGTFILRSPGFNGTLEVKSSTSLSSYSSNSNSAFEGEKVDFTIKSKDGEETIEGSGINVNSQVKVNETYKIDGETIDLFIIESIDDINYEDLTSNYNNDKKFRLSNRLNKSLKTNDQLLDYQMYTGRNGYDNIFEKVNIIVIQADVERTFLSNLFGFDKYNINNQRTEPKSNIYHETILTSFGGNFNHIISSIPISGQAYPTHQFLGSIEPTYHFSFIGNTIDINKKGAAKGIQDLEYILNQCTLQAKTFSVVPDASNIAVDSIITRLLGTYKEDTLTVNAIKDNQGRNIGARSELKPNISLHSSELFTIEGSPNAAGYNVRLSESKHYIQEEIKTAVTTEENYDKYLKKYTDILKNSQYARKKGINLKNLYQRYEYLNWSTKNYTSKYWYSRSHRTAKNIKASKEHDLNAYHLCLLLDEINFYLGQNNKIEIFSTYRGETDLLSSHSVGSATDTYVEGMSSLELAAFIELLLKNNKISKDYGSLSLSKQNKSSSERSNPLSWVGLGVYGDYSIDFFNSTFSEDHVAFLHRTLENYHTSKVYSYRNDSSFSFDEYYMKKNPDFRKSEYLMKKKPDYFLHIDLNLSVTNDANSLTKRNAHSLRNDRRRWVGKSKSAAFRTTDSQTAGQAKKAFWDDHVNFMSEYIRTYLTDLKYESFESVYKFAESNDETNENDSYDFEENDDFIDPVNAVSLRDNQMLNEIENENIFNRADSLKEFLEKQDDTKDIFQKYNKLSFKDQPLNTSNDSTLYENQIVINANWTAPEGHEYDYNRKQIDLIKGQLSRFKNIRLETNLNKYGSGWNGHVYQQQLVIKVKKENYRKERKINKDLLNHFQSLASILLIEPYLYLDEVNQNSIKQEMNRIISELFDIDVIPLHYNYVESNFLGTSHLYINSMTDTESYNSQWDRVSNFSQKQKNVIIGGELAIIMGLILAPVSGGLSLLLIGGGAMAATDATLEGFFDGVSDDALLQLRRVMIGFKGNEKLINDGNQYLEFIKTTSFEDILSELKKSATQRIEDEDEVLYKDFLNKIDQSDTVHEGIQNFSEKIMYNTPLFKKFVDLSTRLKTSSAVRKMIVQNTSGGDFDKYRFNGLSDRLLIGPLEEYMKYLFMFPMRDELFEDEDMASEVFSIGGSESDIFPTFSWNVDGIVPEINRKYFKSGNNLINDQINGGHLTFFEKRKVQLKQLQNERIAYLKGIAKALLEESIVLNKDVLEKEASEVLSVFDGKTVFELLETNAYPDIKLPKSPEDFSSFNENPSMHPMFFIKDFNTYYKNDKNLNNYINSRMNNSRKIVKNSRNFMSAMKNGVVFKLGNQYSNNIKNVKDKDAFKELFEDNDFLIDTYEYPDGNVKLKSTAKVVKNEKESYNQVTINNVKRVAGDPNVTQKIESIKKMNSILFSEFKDVRSMFGSKLGYKRRKTNTNLNPTSFKNNPLEIEDYNPVEISKDASKGITTLPSIKNAFPTFRLYLVEEDNIFSDRLTAYDDFFYYNSVISFSIENNRNLPAATAKIQLQNLSGILDGTRKGDLVDVDIPSDIDEEAIDLKSLYRRYADSIVLRHGINVQLRAGYDSNTNELDILISGRITDISYANNNTICNIIVQSFGVELDTKVKGSSAFIDKNNHFSTTHHLLSYAIMSPELKHFGRRKTGRYFQTFEAMEPSLDMENYSRSNYFDLKYTRTLTDIISDNSIYILALMGFLPFGTIIGGAAKKALGKIVPEMIKGGASRLGNAALSAGKALYDFKAVKAISYVGVKAYKGSVKLAFGNSKVTNEAIKKLLYGYRIQNTIYSRSTDIHKDIVINVAKELKNSSVIGRLISKFNNKYGMNIGNKSVSGKFINNAEKLITRELGYKEALNLGFVNPGIRGELYFQYNVLTGGSLTRSIFGGFLYGIPLLGAAAFYGGFVDSVVSGYNFIADLFETQQKDRFKLTERLLLAPQDDNIFSPDPKLYMHDGSSNGILEFLYEFYDATVLNWAGYDSETIRKKAYEESFFLAEKRLDINKNENLYKINGQTVWKIFKDMSYRHPGYVFGIRPYGNSMEYRMFFGLPNQRYFSKQVTNNVIDRINKIEQDLMVSSKDNLLSETLLNTLYPVYSKNTLENKRHLFSTIAIDEYLRKTKDRFTPFRQYHYITAENNIISNDIVVSGHDLINTMKVHYQVNTAKDGTGSDLSTIEVSSLYNVTDNNRKELVLNDPNRNIKGIANAYRWGMGAILERTKKLYQGSLLILGNTKINTNDVIILKDNITNMHGPLEVDYTIHSFDFQTGFISEIGISALVTGNESLTYPTYNAMIEYEARRELFEKFSSYRTFQENNNNVKDTIKDVVEDMIRKNNSESTVKIDVDDKLTEVITNSIFDEINYRKQNNLPNFVSDVTATNSDAVLALTSGGLDRDDAEAIIKTSLFAVTTSALTSSFLLEKRYKEYIAKGMKSSLGKGTAGLYFGIGSLVFGALTDFGLDKLDDSYETGNLGKNYFKKAIFSSMRGGNNVQLFPLVRDGMPLLAGGFEDVSQKDIWENVYGNIYNGMSDAVSARAIREKEYDEIGRKVLELSETDDDWSVATEILSSDFVSSLFGDETRRKLTGWYLSE